MLPTNSKQTLAALLVVLVSVLLSHGSALAADWVVTRLTGSAWITIGAADRASLEIGKTFPAGSTISTESRSRVLLERGSEAINVGPASNITLPGSADPGGFTTILQDKGEVRFDIETGDKPHFAVRTPFLAALVKGTEFTVAINTGGASVSVHRGLVQVTNNASGKAADIETGQSATVSRSGGRGIVITLNTGWGSGPQSGGNSRPLDEGNGQSGLLRTALDEHSGEPGVPASAGITTSVGGPAAGGGSRPVRVSVSTKGDGFGNLFLNILRGEFELGQGNAETAVAAGLGIFFMHFAGLGLYRRYRNRKKRKHFRGSVVSPVQPEETPPGGHSDE